MDTRYFVGSSFKFGQYAVSWKSARDQAPVWTSKWSVNWVTMLVIWSKNDLKLGSSSKFSSKASLNLGIPLV